MAAAETAASNGAPLWVTILLGAVPIIGAAIAATVALANTMGRRIERLKNLVEIEQKIPSWLNHDNGLELLMIRELKGLESASSPWMRWYRRFLYVCVTTYLVTYGLTFLPGIYGMGVSRVFTAIAIAACIAGVVALRLAKPKREELEISSLVRKGVLELIREDRKKANESRALKDAKDEAQEQD